VQQQLVELQQQHQLGAQVAVVVGLQVMVQTHRQQMAVLVDSAAVVVVLDLLAHQAAQEYFTFFTREQL
jgi:hypothetical protein